jgi:serine/threonine protein kinase
LPFISKTLEPCFDWFVTEQHCLRVISEDVARQYAARRYAAAQSAIKAPSDGSAPSSAATSATGVSAERRIFIASEIEQFNSNSILRKAWIVGQQTSTCVKQHKYPAGCLTLDYKYTYPDVVLPIKFEYASELHIRMLLQQCDAKGEHLHRWLVPLQHVDHSRQALFLPYHPLGDISAYVTPRRKTLTQRQWIKLWMACAQALHLMHTFCTNSGFGPSSHNDIKPYNLVVTDDAKGEFNVKVIDVATLAVQGETCRFGHTDCYAAPELLQKSGHPPAASPAIDVYGLGGVAIFMKYAKPPDEVDFKLHASARNVTQTEDWVWSPALHNLVLSCLNPDPVFRPSLAALMETLNSLLSFSSSSSSTTSASSATY